MLLHDEIVIYFSPNYMQEHRSRFSLMNRIAKTCSQAVAPLCRSISFQRISMHVFTNIQADILVNRIPAGAWKGGPTDTVFPSKQKQRKVVTSAGFRYTFAEHRSTIIAKRFYRSRDVRFSMAREQRKGMKKSGATRSHGAERFRLLILPDKILD